MIRRRKFACFNLFCSKLVFIRWRFPIRRRSKKKSRKSGPNVILLDVVMPQRNGFQVCRDLKSQEMYAKIPVILVTSKTAPSDRYWGEQQGANGYVAKPFTPDELINAVKRFE